MSIDGSSTERVNRSRRRFLQAIGVSTLVGSTAGCLDGVGGGGGPYEIGMVDSLTGTLSPYGERNQRGKDLALAHINDVGIGEDGRELSVIAEDSESANEAGVSAAQKLVNQDGVPLLVGAVSSGVSIAIYDSVVEGTDVVQISQNSTSPLLSERPDLLRMSPSGAAKGAALAKLIADEGHDSVAVTFVNNDYGLGLSDVFEETFEGDVPYNEPHDQGASSFRSELSEMAGTGASAWLFITYAEEFTIMVNEGYEQGFNEEYAYYGAESTIAEEILENTPEGSHDGMTGITESAPVEAENYQQFRSTFEDEYDESPTVWSAFAYDAFMVSAIAAHLADEFTGPAIEQVVRDVTRPEGEPVTSLEAAKEVVDPGGDPNAVNYEGVSGPIDLNDRGDPLGFYQIYRVESHDYEFGDFITG